MIFRLTQTTPSFIFPISLKREAEAEDGGRRSARLILFLERLGTGAVASEPVCGWERDETEWNQPVEVSHNHAGSATSSLYDTNAAS